MENSERRACAELQKYGNGKVLQKNQLAEKAIFQAVIRSESE